MPKQRANSEIVIAGDTVLARSIGRTDLPGGDHETLTITDNDPTHTIIVAVIVRRSRKTNLR